jgi:peptide chain release factor
MLIQISSGNGVDEVCRALWLFYQWLEKERYSFETLQIEYASCKNCFKSLLLQSDDKRFNALEGTLLWRSPSPFRPKHKRKNWYFSLRCYDEENLVDIDITKIIYQNIKSPKKGGQHVNTTNSGVRAIYAPLNLETICYDERSQHRNKQIALVRLLEKVEKLNQKQMKTASQNRWLKGKDIERGQEVKTFVGNTFGALN